MTKLISHDRVWLLVNSGAQATLVINTFLELWTVGNYRRKFEKEELIYKSRAN
jgi:hypothetical protein